MIRGNVACLMVEAMVGSAGLDDLRHARNRLMIPDGTFVGGSGEKPAHGGTVIEMPFPVERFATSCAIARPNALPPKCVSARSRAMVS